ncbi:hypothetical protein D3C81_999780 [compost metagenome]
MIVGRQTPEQLLAELVGFLHPIGAREQYQPGAFDLRAGTVAGDEIPGALVAPAQHQRPDGGQLQSG